MNRIANKMVEDGTKSSFDAIKYPWRVPYKCPYMKMSK